MLGIYVYLVVGYCFNGICALVVYLMSNLVFFFIDMIFKQIFLRLMFLLLNKLLEHKTKFQRQILFH